MINWPAVIKYEGDEELTYISSEKEWISDAASHLYNHKGDDLLIDSSGHVFKLDHINDEVVNPEISDNQMSLQDFIRLVRIHASNSHQCCIEKINFRNIREGINLVGRMSES